LSPGGSSRHFARSRTDLTPAPTNDLSSSQANFGGSGRTSEVGLYLPNPLGIYDLHSNVWEWTSSPEGSSRVVRGGGWRNQAASCTASYRDWDVPGNSFSSLGFRLLAVPSD
jgi:formylglycine-generating enzyme required for sulfatase activity